MGSSVSGSKFSRWFNKETSPVLRRETDSRRSSLQDETIVNNIINGECKNQIYVRLSIDFSCGVNNVWKYSSANVENNYLYNLFIIFINAILFQKLIDFNLPNLNNIVVFLPVF